MRTIVDKKVVRLLCLMFIAIISNACQSFISKYDCSNGYDINYKKSTICFKIDDNVISAYVKELCNDSIKPDGTLTPLDYNNKVTEYLADNVTLESIETLKVFARKTLRNVGFKENKRFTICIFIDDEGEVVGVKFIYDMHYKNVVDAEDIYVMTCKIRKDVKFMSPRNNGCNVIQIYIPIN